MQSPGAERRWHRPRRYGFDLAVIGTDPSALALVEAQLAATPRARVSVIEHPPRGGLGVVPAGVSALPAGVEVRPGWARLLDPWTLQISGPDGRSETLTTRRILLAVGTEAVQPELPGLDQVRCCAADDPAEMANQPAQPLVLGGGNTGVALALALAEGGSSVVLIERAPRLLVDADLAVAEGMRQRLTSAGVRVCTRAFALRVTAVGEGGSLCVQDADGRHVFPFDALFVASGRRPRLDGLGLEALGYDTSKPLAVDRRHRTRLPHILACGEVAEDVAEPGAARATRPVLGWARGWLSRYLPDPFLPGVRRNG